MNIGFVAAALLSVITFGVHTFVGGKYAARPLLEAHDFHRASRWLNYFTWHMATVLLLVMAAGYAWAAVAPAAWPAALILTVMAALFSPLCVWVAMKGGIQPWRFPASWLFALIVIAAIFGLAERYALLAFCMVR